MCFVDSRSSPGRELSPDPNLPHIGPRFPPGRYTFSFTQTSHGTNTPHGRSHSSISCKYDVKCTYRLTHILIFIHLLCMCVC